MTLSVLVCDSDELVRRALGRVLAEHGLQLVAEATTAVEAAQLAAAFAVDVVVISNELQGLPGLDVVAELGDAGRRVVFISNDVATLDQARMLGAFFAIERGDLATFEKAVDAIGQPVVPGERRSGLDRRSGEDRRLAQDWGKVIRERRSGDDRRLSDRRSPVSVSSEPTDRRAAGALGV